MPVRMQAKFNFIVTEVLRLKADKEIELKGTSGPKTAEVRG